MTDLFLETARAGDVPPGDGWLSREEREVLTGLAVAKRRADWHLGRWVARRAVEWALAAGDDGPSGAPVSDPPNGAAFSILASEDGAPEARAPDGSLLPVSLSISHSADLGMAVAAPGLLALGCDVEVVEPRSDLFVADYFTPREREFVAQAGGPGSPEGAQVATLIWSAKEAALKALRQGLRADTRSVEVKAGAGEAESGAGSPGGSGAWRRLAVETEAGTLPGRWRVAEGAVWVVLADRAIRVV